MVSRKKWTKKSALWSISPGQELSKTESRYFFPLLQPWGFFRAPSHVRAKHSSGIGISFLSKQFRKCKVLCCQLLSGQNDANSVCRAPSCPSTIPTTMASSQLGATLIPAGPHRSDSPFHTLPVKSAPNWNCYQCVGIHRCKRQMHGVTDRFWNDMPGFHQVLERRARVPSRSSISTSRNHLPHPGRCPMVSPSIQPSRKREQEHPQMLTEAWKEIEKLKTKNKST